MWHAPRQPVAHHLQYIPPTPRPRPPRPGAVAWARPFAHENRDGVASARVRPGDVIWLARWPLLHGLRLPPGLDARVEVAAAPLPEAEAACRAAEAEGRQVFPAGPGSAWLPLGDDSALLEGLHGPSAAGPRALLAAPRAGRPAGLRLALGARRLRTLDEPSAAALDAWWGAQVRAPAPVVFVSYAWSDGAAAAAALVGALVGAGARAWLDVAGVPRSVWHRLDDGVHRELRRGLSAALHGARHVVAVATPGWAASPWTRWEAEHAGPRLCRWAPEGEDPAAFTRRLLGGAA